MNLGAKLRQARTKGGMSLEDVSVKSGLSLSFISQIENNKANPSIGSLKKITDALGMQFASLFENQPERENTYEGEGKQVFLVRASNRKSMKMPGSDVEYYLLSPDLNRKMEFLLTIANPGVDSGKEFFSHYGEECGVVIKGRVEFSIAGKSYLMEQGDSIYFDSSVPHSWRNLGNVNAELIWVITPPSF